MLLDVVEKGIGTPTSPVHLGSNVYAPFIYFAILTHAVEEYGKLLYIQSLTPNLQNMIEIEYERGRNSNGTFTDHNAKFAIASSALPPTVTVINGGFGNNFGGNYGLATTPTWDARLEILNTDIDLNGEPTNITSQIDLNRLRASVFEFKNIVYLNRNVT
ncbi:conserved hypothetical protein [Candidatus Nitrosotenuis uzonensis]|uniref:Uncharacterized protein n=2 Tax=Candidatus Nitrosotenuis uzonensis TaxID=1407055 RepID=A0A812EXN4_9ARCH|nr:conserved hypothetical protein [Candidatus Nitrosotenuis uzonensis]